jgi:polysaccharide biosynthesis/export protein
MVRELERVWHERNANEFVFSGQEVHKMSNSKWRGVKWLLSAVVVVSFGQLVNAQQMASLNVPVGDTSTKSDDPRPELHHRPHYLVQRSDTLMLTFPIATDFTQTVKVKPDGFITLAGAGEVYVENMDVAQVHEVVEKAYVGAKILHDPVFTVDVIEFQLPFYVVIGQVNKPGKYELREDITATSAIAEAGGFVTGYAKSSKVVVFHRINADWSEAKTIDLKHLLNSKNLAEDIHLQPGDIVYVPQNGFSKFKSIVPYTVPAGIYANPANF